MEQNEFSRNQNAEVQMKYPEENYSRNFIQLNIQLKSCIQLNI